MLKDTELKDIESKDIESKDIELKTINISVILSLVTKLHNILRNNGNNTESSYDTINKLLFIKFIQPYLNDRLSALSDPSFYRQSQNFNDINIRYLDINYILSINDHDEFGQVMLYLWKYMLAVHPLTSNIFYAKAFFECKYSVLYECLFLINETLDSLLFDKLDGDIKGSIYEYFRNAYSGNGGKSLGQYFTPHKLINIINKLHKETFENYKSYPCEYKKIYDPAAGTAGFLISTYKMLNRTPELYGCEIEHKVYTTSLMNILLTTGSLGNITLCDSLKYNSNLKHDNSLKTNDSSKTNDNLKYDYIVSNPPFGTKHNHKLLDKNIYMIKTNNGSALFLQHCMAKLADNGRCTIILPCGELLSGKTYIKLRQELVENFDLKAILLCENGVFTHTSVKVAVLFFANPQYIKNKKKVYSNTIKVNFYEMYNECNDYKLLETIPYDEIRNNKYSFIYSDYKKQHRVTTDTRVYKKLSEICNFIPNVNKHNKKDNNGNNDNINKYNFYTCAKEIYKIDVCDFTELSIILNMSGSANVRIDSNFSTTTHVSVLRADNPTLTKYIYYYLQTQLNYIQSNMKGIGLPNITKEFINNIEIPINNVDEIVKQCDILEDNKHMYNKLLQLEISAYEIYRNNAIKTTNMVKIKDICENVKGKKYNVSDGKELSDEKAIYPLVCSSTINKVRWLETYEYKGPYICLGTGGDANIHYYENFNICSDMKVLSVKNIIEVPSVKNNINIKYLYYYLKHKINDISYLFKGATIKHIDMESINNFEVNVPSIEMQLDFVDKCTLYEKNIDHINDNINRINDNETLQLLFH